MRPLFWILEYCRDILQRDVSLPYSNLAWHKSWREAQREPSHGSGEPGDARQVKRVADKPCFLQPQCVWDFSQTRAETGGAWRSRRILISTMVAATTPSR